jgi:hypothetical protein
VGVGAPALERIRASENDVHLLGHVEQLQSAPEDLCAGRSVMAAAEMSAEGSEHAGGLGHARRLRRSEDDLHVYLGVAEEAIRYQGARLGGAGLGDTCLRTVGEILGNGKQALFEPLIVATNGGDFLFRPTRGCRPANPRSQPSSRCGTQLMTPLRYSGWRKTRLATPSRSPAVSPTSIQLAAG